MRLIDADALIEQWEADAEQMDKPLAKMFANAAINDVNRARTIEPEPQWIPCSERLPEDDGDYLILCRTLSKYKPYVYDVASFANDLYQIDKYDFCDMKGQKGWFYNDSVYGFCEYYGVYAWMPLPEPYQEEGEN